METNLITIVIPYFFLLIGFELVYSVITKKKLYNFNDSISDLGTGTANRIFGLFFQGITTIGYIYLYENFRLYTFPIQTTFQYVLTFIICFFLYDFFYYWMHRMSHEVNLLWSGHIVHHQSEEFNLTVALRQPSFHGLFTWIFYLPLALFGIPPIIMIYNSQINLIYQFWIHTEVIDKMGFLEKFLNTPSHHRVHHGINPSYIDTNHGGTLIIWDKIFGTFQEENEPVVYGTVKPLKDFNPIWANFYYLKELVLLSWKSNSIIDSFLVWFKEPGWLPKNLGTKSEPPKVDRTKFVKYFVPLSLGSKIYVIFWYLVTTVVVLILLEKYHLISNFHLVMVSFLLLATLYAIGGMLENKKWLFYFEPVRIILILIYFLTYYQYIT